MKVRNDAMSFLGMGNEGGEQIESFVHSSISVYEHIDEHPRAIQEEYYNLFNEESIMPIAIPVCGSFEEACIPPLYDKYEDDYLGDEGPMWDLSSCPV